MLIAVRSCGQCCLYCLVLCLQAFHETLESKRDNAMEVIQKCSHMLRETTKEEGDVAKGRIEHVRSLIGMKCEYKRMPEIAVLM